jgi:hypothetical protein
MPKKKCKGLNIVNKGKPYRVVATCESEAQVYIDGKHLCHRCAFHAVYEKYLDMVERYQMKEI